MSLAVLSFKGQGPFPIPPRTHERLGVSTKRRNRLGEGPLSGKFHEPQDLPCPLESGRWSQKEQTGFRATLVDELEPDLNGLRKVINHAFWHGALPPLFVSAAYSGLMHDLGSQIRVEPRLQQRKCQILTTRPPGSSSPLFLGCFL